MAQIVVELPGTPPSPNRSRRYGHWAQRARSDRQWKSDAYVLAVDARQHSGRSDFPWSRVALAIRFTVPTRARRDPDNAIASLKPAIDGLVSAGLIVDDSGSCIERFGPVEFVHVPGQRSVRFTIDQL